MALTDFPHGALDGLLVADFSRVLAGPLASTSLGDLGATVVKVERPGTGDETRAWGPPYGDDGESSYFLSANRNKRSVVLDLADPADRELARELACRADVLVENFRPGVADRLGLGYESLRTDNPRLVYASITGFGSTGEGAKLGGYDFLVQAVGGLMSVTGWPDGEPTKVGVAVVDVLASLNLQVGVLAALRARDTTGVGQLVEVSLLSSVLAGLVNQSSSYLTAGSVAGRLGNRHPSITPYETLATADRQLVVAVGNDDQFRRFCAVLDVPALAADPRFGTNAARVGHRDELVAELERALASRPATDWVDRLSAVGLPAGVVNRIDEAFALAERLGLDPVVKIPRSDGPPVPQTANPIRLAGTPIRYDLPPPRFGEHSEDIRIWLTSPREEG